MSTALASHLILHPTVSRVLKVLATTVGRDKTYRLIQYLSRLIAWYLLRQGGPDAKLAAIRWDGLKSGLASGRKMLRLVKPLEHLQSAMNVANAPRTAASSLAPLAGNIASFAQLGRQLAYAGYLSTDMIVWLQGVKFLRLDSDRMARINKISQRCWLTGIALSLLSSTSALVRLRAEGRRFALVGRAGAGGGEKDGFEMGVEGDAERREKGRAMLKERQLIISQIVQDSMDFWIPANNLGFSHLNDGVIGALGAATSYMALQQQWIKVNGPVAAKK